MRIKGGQLLGNRFKARMTPMRANIADRPTVIFCSRVIQFFCHEVRLRLIRPCQRLALVAWPGGGFCLPNGLSAALLQLLFFQRSAKRGDRYCEVVQCN